jgi:hypothetical protein
MDIVLRLAVLVGEELAVICFDTPELSASMMVDSSAESAGPGEGVRSRVNAIYYFSRPLAYMSVKKINILTRR